MGVKTIMYSHKAHAILTVSGTCCLLAELPLAHPTENMLTEGQLQLNVKL